MAQHINTLPSQTKVGAVRFVVGGIGVLLSAFVALYSFRYLLQIGPVPDLIARNLFRTPWLVIHVGGAATALLLGPLQFSSSLRNRFRGLHHWIGRVYVISCLVGGVAGFVLAVGTVTGPISTLGFGSLAVLWIITTALAWRRAMQGRFVEHRAWMIRSFALTFAAVTLRLYLPFVAFLSIPFVNGYRAISFLCWVPNLLIAELYLRRRRL